MDNKIKTAGKNKSQIGPSNYEIANELPLTEEEIRKMRLEVIRTDVNIQIGDKVEVIDGPLMNMLGIVLTVDEVNSRAKVNVEMFGRETPVDLDFSQLRVIKD